MEQNRALFCRGAVLMGKTGKSFAAGTGFGGCSANAMSPEKLSGESQPLDNPYGYQQVKASHGVFRKLPHQNRPVLRRLAGTLGQ